MNYQENQIKPYNEYSYLNYTIYWSDLYLVISTYINRLLILYGKKIDRKIFKDQK